MPNPDVFLSQFLDDVNSLIIKCQYQCYLAAFVCDAPVRANLKNIISHSGYTTAVNAVFKKKALLIITITLPSSECVSQTDDPFRNRTDKNHYKTVLLNT